MSPEKLHPLRREPARPACSGRNQEPLALQQASKAVLPPEQRDPFAEYPDEMTRPSGRVS